MQILFGEIIEKEDRYQYQIKSGGDLNIKTEGQDSAITLIFVNGKFERMWQDYHATGRSHWHINKAIADKITELEERYAAPRQEQPTTHPEHKEGV